MVVTGLPWQRLVAVRRDEVLEIPESFPMSRSHSRYAQHSVSTIGLRRSRLYANNRAAMTLNQHASKDFRIWSTRGYTERVRWIDPLRRQALAGRPPVFASTQMIKVEQLKRQRRRCDPAVILPRALNRWGAEALTGH